MALLDDVKLALRISPGTTAYDGEVQDLIDAAKADLRLSGVDPAKLDESTPSSRGPSSRTARPLRV